MPLFTTAGQMLTSLDPPTLVSMDIVADSFKVVEPMIKPSCFELETFENHAAVTLTTVTMKASAITIDDMMSVRFVLFILSV